jgi:hypothetical protein
LANSEVVDSIFHLLDAHKYVDTMATLQMLSILGRASSAIAKRIRFYDDVIVKIALIEGKSNSSRLEHVVNFLQPVARSVLGGEFSKNIVHIFSTAKAIRERWMDSYDKQGHPFLIPFELKIQSRAQKPKVARRTTKQTEEAKLQSKNKWNAIKRKHNKHKKQTKLYMPKL